MRILPALLVMALILIMSITPGSQVGDYFNPVVKPIRAFLRQTEFGEFLTRPDWLKVGHVIAYGILGAVLYTAVRHSAQRALLWSILIVFTFACLDELVQSFVPGRSASFSDVLLDTTAGIVAMIVMRLATKLRSALTASRSTEDG